MRRSRLIIDTGILHPDKLNVRGEVLRITAEGVIVAGDHDRDDLQAAFFGQRDLMPYDIPLFSASVQRTF